MERLRHRIVRGRAGWAWLILVAVALRLLVPAGFMPAAQGGALVACPEWGGATIAHHRGASHDDAHGPHSHAEPTCPFAALGLPMLVGDGPPSLALAAEGATIASATAWRDVLFLAPSRLRPPAQAPPRHG